MFKYLLLKSIFDVSDVDVVERSKYDMSFKYFLDIAPGDGVLLLGVYNSFHNNNLVELLEHHRKVIEIPALYSLDEPFIPSIKEAIRMAGIPIPTFSLPPTNIWSAQKEQKLTEIFNRAGIPLAE